MRQGRTGKPCPLCKQKPDRYNGRETDGVCDDCQKEVERLKEIETQFKKSLKGEKAVIMGAKNVYYDYPYICSHGGREELFEKTFHQIVEKVAIFDTTLDQQTTNKTKDFFPKEYYSEQDRAYHHYTYILINPELAVMLRTLYMEAKRLIEEEYKYGKKEGMNILLSLNSGELGMKDFEEQLKQS